MELYKKYRPKKFFQIIGQDAIVSNLKNKIKKHTLPHSILLSGPSGCGKTTIARILARYLKCSKSDFNEINSANFRGIDMIRTIQSRMNTAPMDGECKVYLIDEVHKLSNDAMNAFLKILEDTPKHVYFFLCTTEPQKLLKTIRTRCMDISVKPLNNKQMKELLESICKKANLVIELSEEVVNKIIENADGSPRQALVYLDVIKDCETEEEMIDCIIQKTSETVGFDIAKALINPKAKWSDISKLLKEVEGQDIEQIRRIILGYAKAVMLNNKLVNRCYLIIDAFRDNYFDSGMAGLVASCFEVSSSK